MEKFKVISGTKKNYKPTEKHYFMALNRLLQKIENQKSEQQILDKETTIKLVFLSVKAFCAMKNDGLTMDEAKVRFNAVSDIMSYMALLTPTEFIRLFPIPKEYDGKKYSVKDYFSTIERLKKYPLDEEIGEDKIIEFLMEYYNGDIIKFEVKKLCLISYIRRLNGQKGVMEEFCEENDIPTYSYYEAEGIMVESGTGKAVKVEKPKRRKPKYLKVVE